MRGCRLRNRIPSQPRLIACGSDSVQEEATLNQPAHAEQTTVRWQAMADFYERHDLLNRTIDPEMVTEQTAVRWQAMADFYERHDLLTH